MIAVANPIYDVVFKYLMEDERIARTILSALLKENIVKVEMRPHEYSNDKGASIALLRIDFAATVRRDDGSDQLILIELQKTWIETETLRFRQYLGAQYENPKNMLGDRKEYAMPMVAVYLLGHRVGEIEEPVIYVKHRVMDYNERPVEKGLPNAFVESLTHDSIIVQIPLLHGQLKHPSGGRARNRLDYVLSFFDQTYKDQENRKVLNLDDSLYRGDSDMQCILNRLASAASSPKVRQDMNIEEEFFSVLESRDEAILNRDYELAKQAVQLKEQNAQLEEQSAQIEEQSAQIEEQSAQIEEQSAQIEEQSAQLEEQSAQLEEQSAQIEEQSAQIEEQSAQIEEQSAQLRKSVKTLASLSLTPEQIAESLGMKVETVKEMMKETN